MSEIQSQNPSEINYEYLEDYQSKVKEFLDLILKKIDALQAQCSTVSKSFNNAQQIIQIADIFEKAKLQSLIEQIRLVENQIKPGISQIQSEKSEFKENLEICQKLFEQQQYQQSIDILKSLDQNNDQVLFWMAKNLQKQNKVEEAKDLYQKVIQINQENELAYNNLGIILLYERKFENALKQFEISLQLNDNDENFHLNKGAALLNLEKYEDSLIASLIALDIKPKLEQAYLQISQTLIKMRYSKLALYYLNKAIRIFPNFHRFYYDKGVILFNKTQSPDAEETKQALDCFNKALSLNMENSNYLQLKAKTLAYMGKNKEAILEYEKILLKPDYKNKEIIVQEIFQLKQQLQNGQNK